ncbi:MAG: hypothetical protein HY791_27265 [Deltaproteobacteria bacterium]|nr:hypothetical protein [Deltaproteobacteria bacterium]
MRTRAFFVCLVVACSNKVETPDAGPARIEKKPEPPTMLAPGCPLIEPTKRKPLSENERGESAHVFVSEMPGDQGWEQTLVFTSINPNERMRQVRTAVVDGKRRYLFASTSDEDKCERFYELDEDAKEPHVIASHPEGEVEDPRAFAIEESSLHFQLGKEVWKYALGKRTRPVASNSDALGGAARRQYLAFGIAEITSPDQKSKLSLSGAQITLYAESGSREVLVKQDFTGAWSIGQAAFSDDSKTLFFDNAGKNACIWELHLPTKSLTKVVPEHEAEHPFFFRKDGREGLAYVERNTVRVSVRSETPRESMPPWKIAPTASEIDELIPKLGESKWLRAVSENGQTVINEYCSAEVPSVALAKSKNRGFPQLVFGFGQDTATMRVVYLAERAGDLLVVFEDPDAKEKTDGYRIQLRKKSGGFVTWGHDTRGGDFGKEITHVPAGQVSEVIALKVEDCEELLGTMQAQAGPLLTSSYSENGSIVEAEILGADLAKEKVAFRAFYEVEGAVECGYAELPKAGEVWGTYSLEKDKVLERIEVRPSATKASGCGNPKSVADKRKAATAKLGKLIGKGKITREEGGSLVVAGSERKVKLTTKTGRIDGQSADLNTTLKAGETPIFGALYNGKARVYVRYHAGEDGSMTFPSAAADGGLATVLEKHTIAGKVSLSFSPVLKVKEL